MEMSKFLSAFHDAHQYNTSQKLKEQVLKKKQEEAEKKTLDNVPLRNKTLYNITGDTVKVSNNGPNDLLNEIKTNMAEEHVISRLSMRINK